MTAASKRPDLAPGASYGEDITLADLRIGDEFYAPQTPRRAQIGGTIEKLSRVTFGYKTLYMERIEMHLTTRKTELVGGYVLRGKVVHMIVAPPSGATPAAE